MSEDEGVLISWVHLSIQSIWFTLAVWRTTEGPKFRPGFIFASTLGACIVLLSLVIRALQSQDEKQRAETGETVSDSELPAADASKSAKIADGAVAEVFKGENVSAV